MFISFSKVLNKVGGFHIGLKGRVTSKNALWGALIYLTVVMFQLMWYSALLVGWLFYAFIYGCVVLTKKMFIILSEQVGKLKAAAILTVVYSGIILILILISSASSAPTTPPEASTQPTIAETTTQSTTEATTEATTEVTTEPTETTTEPSTDPSTEPIETTESNYEFTTDYVLNTNSRKFHYSWCSSAKQTKESNKAYFTGTRDEVIQKGYSPCGRCTP